MVFAVHFSVDDESQAAAGSDADAAFHALHLPDRPVALRVDPFAIFVR